MDVRSIRGRPRDGVRLGPAGALLLGMWLLGNWETTEMVAAEPREPVPRTERQHPREGPLVERLQDRYLNHPDYYHRQEALRHLQHLDARSWQIRRLGTSAPSASWNSYSRPGLFVLAQHHRYAGLIPHPWQQLPLEQSPAWRQLESSSYLERQRAYEHLLQSAQTAATARTVMVQCRRRLAQPQLSPQARHLLLVLYRKARATWLVTEPDGSEVPAISARRAEQLVARMVAAEQPFVLRAAAQRELVDAMMRDENVPLIRQALASWLEKDLDDHYRMRALEELWLWCQPGVVAEVWQSRKLVTVQHLALGVPQYPAGAMTATLFDRADRHKARCVQGNSLVQGEYPCHRAIAHPQGIPGVMFHLVYVPTPRKRFQYQARLIRIPQQEYLAEITRRTCQGWIDQKHYLEGHQWLLLAELDPQALSQSLAAYLLAVPDRPLRRSHGPQSLEAASHHGKLCRWLAASGTRQAVPALVQAIRQERLLPPDPQRAPYHWPWIALLAIASRNASAELDPLLVNWIEVRQVLIHREPSAVREPPPEVGAGAAALLLDRYHVPYRQFGLEEVRDRQLYNVGCPAYRFRSEEDRRRVIQWCKQLPIRTTKLTPKVAER